MVDVTRYGHVSNATNGRNAEGSHGAMEARSETTGRPTSMGIKAKITRHEGTVRTRDETTEGEVKCGNIHPTGTRQKPKPMTE